MNETPKLVFSRTLQRAAWSNCRVAHDISAEVAALKSAPGKDIILCGGPGIVQSFTRLGLIDDYYIVVYPLLLGGGLRLFTDLPAAHALELVESKGFTSGAALLHYRAREAHHG
jgi:dihydrofolate reductase